jgi:hypothetical protein
MEKDMNPTTRKGVLEKLWRHDETAGAGNKWKLLDQAGQ